MVLAVPVMLMLVGGRHTGDALEFFGWTVAIGLAVTLITSWLDQRSLHLYLRMRARLLHDDAGRHVRLDSLVDVRIHRWPPGVRMLRLCDSEGGRLAVPLRFVGAHQHMWDVIYDGILRATARGATVNASARRLLELPDR